MCVWVGVGEWAYSGIKLFNLLSRRLKDDAVVYGWVDGTEQHTRGWDSLRVLVWG